MHDLQQTIQTLLDYVKGIWIRKRYLIVCSWLICPLGFIYVATLPDVYESEAVVYVDTRSMLKPLLTGISLYNNPDSEVRMMAQTLKSRSNIEEVARQSDLDVTVTTDAEYENLILGLTSEIKLSSTRRSNIYTISYKHKKPQVARTVVQETLNVFVEGSLGGTRNDSNSASRFIDEQIAEYEARLSEAEQQRADFRRKHSDVLPLEGTYHTKLQSLIDKLSNTGLEIREAEQKAETLRGQLTNTRIASDKFAVQGGDSAPVITTRFDDRITNLETRIDELMLRFTEKHPDVIESQELLKNLRASREEDIATYLSQDNDGRSPILSDLNQEITLEISRLEGEIASLRVREEDFQRKTEELRTLIDLVPQIEAEGISKNRNYEIIKIKYEELLTRKEAADISNSAKASTEELQFRIIKPPLVPTTTAGPKRFLFYTMVLILGFGTGIALAFILSQLKPILVRGHQLTSLTGFPIWGSVTHLDLKEMKRKQRFKALVFFASSGAIFFMYLVLVATDIMNINILSKVLA